MNAPSVLASPIYEVDKTGPTIDAGTNITANSATALNPSLGDAVSLTWSGTGLTFSNSTLATSTVAAPSHGLHSVALTATDAAGNSSVDSLVLDWDLVGPTVDAGADIVIGTTVTRTASADADATNHSWTKVSGPGTITFSAPNSLTTDISASLDGDYVLRFTTEDPLGNQSFDEINFKWDTTGVSVNVGSDITVKASNEAARAPTVSGEGGSPSFQWTYTGPGTLTFTPNDTTKDLTNISASAQGTYTVTLTVTNTGNSAVGSDSFNLTWDTVAPSITNIDPAGDISGDSLLGVSERTQTNPLVANLSGSGHDTVEYTVTTSATACSAATGYSSSIPLSNDTRIVADGAYKVCVKLTDNADNTPAYDDSVTFTVDTTAPTSNSIDIDSGATYDNDANVTLTLSSTGASEMKISNTADCSLGSYEAFAASKAWTLTDLNTTATVSVMYKDAAGNETICYSDSIIHDDIAPTVPTISIAGGADFTTSTSVTLSLSATDATHMYITNTLGCATGGVDEAIQSSKAWTLGQTNALATVYVKYRDEAGNWTACINDTITHDDTDPTLTITNSGWINASNFTSYAVTGACNENGRTVIIGGDASGSATCDGTSYSANVNYTPVADGAFN